MPSAPQTAKRSSGGKSPGVFKRAAGFAKKHQVGKKILKYGPYVAAAAAAGATAYYVHDKHVYHGRLYPAGFKEKYEAEDLVVAARDAKYAEERAVAKALHDKKWAPPPTPAELQAARAAKQLAAEKKLVADEKDLVRWDKEMDARAKEQAKRPPKDFRKLEGLQYSTQGRLSEFQALRD